MDYESGETPFKTLVVIQKKSMSKSFFSKYKNNVCNLINCIVLKKTILKWSGLKKYLNIGGCKKRWWKTFYDNKNKNRF